MEQNIPFHEEVNGCIDTQGPESRHTIEYHLTPEESRGCYLIKCKMTLSLNKHIPEMPARKEMKVFNQMHDVFFQWIF